MTIPAVLPFGWSGNIEVAAHANASPDAIYVTQLLESAINRKLPRSLVRKDSTLEFRGGMFRFVWNWNLLVSIIRGHIQVDPTAMGLRVSYRIYFTELLLFVTLGAALVAFAPTFFLGPAPTTISIDRFAQFRENAEIFLFGWLWLYGLNVVVTLLRFPAFLRQSIGSI